jgi:DNA-binding NarL/FixJ family response regulator
VSTRIALADDHPILREGIRAVLEAETDFVVVGETGDGLQVSQLVERARPEVLILEVVMPGLSGLEIIRQVSRRFPATRVLVLSMHASEAYVLEALRNGAAGYVLKESAPAELVQAVREISCGRRYLSKPLTDLALEAYFQNAKAAPLDIYEVLSPREREVFQLVAEGKSHSEIADRLSISPRTVETHRTNLMQKLRLHSHADLIRFALRRGIIPME